MKTKMIDSDTTESLADALSENLRPAILALDLTNNPGPTRKWREELNDGREAWLSRGIPELDSPLSD